MSEERAIPIWEKFALTINEATEYFNIGEKKIRTLVDNFGDNFSVLNGSKVLIKRKQFEDFLNKTTTI